MKKTFLTALFISATTLSFAQVGVNTNQPMTALDVNGSFSTSQSEVTVNSNVATLDNKSAFYKINGATAAFTINFSTTPNYSYTGSTTVPNGQRIVIYNNTNYTGTYGSFSIPSQTAQEFIHSGGSWYSVKAAAQESPFPAELKWFYAPSLVLDTSITSTARTVNIFDNYTKQFTKNSSPLSTSANDNYGFVSSNASATTIPKYSKASDFDYFITGYDRTVFSDVSISTEGLLSYKISSVATEKTFMNIVMVPK